MPDTAAGFCDYSGGTPTRCSYVTGAKFETRRTAGADPMQPMAPFYFPLVYTSTNTTTGNAFGGSRRCIGLFDWRPKDIDEALVAAESDDNGKTWYFMQTVLELFPDYTNPISGGYSPRRRHRLPGDDHRDQRERDLGERLDRRRRLGPRGDHPAARRGQREDGPVPVHARPQHHRASTSRRFG